MNDEEKLGRRRAVALAYERYEYREIRDGGPTNRIAVEMLMPLGASRMENSGGCYGKIHFTKASQ